MFLFKRRGIFFIIGGKELLFCSFHENHISLYTEKADDG